MFHQPLTICFSLYYFYSSFLHLCRGCFPPAYYGTYPHYQTGISGGLGRPYADSADFNFIREEHPSLFAAPSNLRENFDVIQATSDLNCRRFDSNCRWSNTNEDELDWKVLMTTPEAEPLVSMLQTSPHLPDATAAVLLSGNRNTYDSGQLVSDLLPCIVTPLQLTATVWRSSSSSNGPFQQQQQQQQPTLQICSRNTHTDQPYSNCNLFPIQNGIPVTVNVPEPRDPTTPAQIILLGDNFVGKYGAIFVQDIIVDGDVVPDCTVISFPRKHFNKQQPQQNLIPQDSTSFVKVQELSPMQKIFSLRQPSKLQLASPSISDSLIVECLKLSCNPAQKDCGWQGGTAGWMASRGTDNLSNPLTGIIAPPDGTDAFLVASYNSNSKNSIRQIISPLINIPISIQPVYFCFYEYFALEGARFTMCIDAVSKGCFYSKINISKDGNLQANRRWNFQCTKLPIGTYKIYVTAENNGSNQGDIGFVPLRLSQDLAGNDPIC